MAVGISMYWLETGWEEILAWQLGRELVWFTIPYGQGQTLSVIPTYD